MVSSHSHPQREWILIGIAECCAARGFELTTVEGVCAAAGASREAFDREFADLDECLGAAMELVVEEAWRSLDEAGATDKPWPEGLRVGVEALLGLLSERPAFARLALVEAPLAGGRAAVLHDSARAALLEFVERGLALAEPGIPKSAARGALAGAEALVEKQILAGRAAQLADLTPDIAYMLAVPFLGVGEARRLAAAPAKRGLRAVA